MKKMGAGLCLACVFVAAWLTCLIGCAGPQYCGVNQNELEDSFVPLASFKRLSPVECDHVVFLEKAPVDRKYRELGIISPVPPRGMKSIRQKSWGGAVHAACAAAALKGADAIYLMSEKEAEEWQFKYSASKGSGGKSIYTNLRVKAIVWE